MKSLKEVNDFIENNISNNIFVKKIFEVNVKLLEKIKIASTSDKLFDEQLERGVFYRLFNSIFACNKENNPNLKIDLMYELSLFTLGDKVESMGLVSIVMPTFNRGYVISDAILSILEQKYQNFEILICDDDSQDNTEAVVKSFNDPRIKYYKLPKGNGAIARNFGLKKAKGKFLAFLDSDNVWHPNHLLWAINALVKKEKDITYTCYWDIEYIKGNPVLIKSGGDDFDYSRFSHRNYIDLNTIVLKRAVYERCGGFDEDLVRQQDWDLLLRFFSYYDPLFLSCKTVIYQRNIGWDQVTNKYKNIDVRSLVMAKNAQLVKRRKRNLYPLAQGIRFDGIKKIAIKISAPNLQEGVRWGDYHFAHQLGKAMQKLGYEYQVDCQDTWYDNSDPCVLNFVIRGRHRFLNKNNQKNILWIISHPDRLAKGEFEDYDHIFVASKVFADKVKKVTKVPVDVLLQATDLTVFGKAHKLIELPQEIVFIGNSRNEYRNMVKWMSELDYPLGVWGGGWEKFINRDQIISDYISNDDLGDYYASCSILLNDHWLSMANNGFISNRIFDASASGAFIISDEVKGIEDIFGDNVCQVKDKNELKEKIDFFMGNKELMKIKSQKAREIVLREHTFDNRAQQIKDLLNSGH